MDMMSYRQKIMSLQSLKIHIMEVIIAIKLLKSTDQVQRFKIHVKKISTMLWLLLISLLREDKITKKLN